MSDSKRLKRYAEFIRTEDKGHAGIFPDEVGEFYLASEADAVISALEAENEGLREALAGFLNWSSGHGHYELNTLRREGLDILNREQEKQ